MAKKLTCEELIERDGLDINGHSAEDRVIADMIKSVIVSRQVLDMTYCDRILGLQRTLHRKLSDVRRDKNMTHLNMELYDKVWNDYNSNQEDYTEEHRGGVKALESMVNHFAAQSDYEYILKDLDLLSAITKSKADWYRHPYQCIVRDGLCEDPEVNTAAQDAMTIGFQKDLQDAGNVKLRWWIRS